jgi:hypothetical protein
MTSLWSATALLALLFSNLVRGTPMARLYSAEASADAPLATYMDTLTFEDVTTDLVKSSLAVLTRSLGS